MTTPVMSDETLNAICGIFEKPKTTWKMVSFEEWAKAWAELPVDVAAGYAAGIDYAKDPDYGYSNPLKSVHWEAP